MKKSSSFHKITADSGSFLYKIMVRVLYFPLNFINNLFPSKKLDKELQVSRFMMEDEKKLTSQYQKLDILCSPARKLSDLFWVNYNWQKLEELIGRFNICDIGCGGGRYYSFINDTSGCKINRYLGIDIKENKNWEKLKKNNNNVNFTLYNGKDVFNEIPVQTNLIISQSAIEHFIEDITIFKQIRRFIDNSNHPVVQIHLFPAAKCLWLYRFHGVRQYTPRTISKITELFKQKYTKELIQLGGKECFKTHLAFVKKGVFGKDFRKSRTEEYNKFCHNAILSDVIQDKQGEAVFYALVIKPKSK